MTRRLGRGSFALLIAVMIAIGVWPPTLPSNQAAIDAERGLVLRGWGQLITDEAIVFDPTSFTVELWLRHDPDRQPGANQQILTLLDRQGAHPFLLGHWPGGYIVRLRRDNPEGSPKKDRYTRWRDPPPREHVAVVSDETGVRILHNGCVAKKDGASFRPAPSSRIEGRLVLGSSGPEWPRWAGSIEAVAIHARVLDADTLAHRARLLPVELAPALRASDALFACTFLGQGAKDCRPPLLRPETVTHPEAAFLGFRWNPRRDQGWLLQDGLLNVLFFVPLGVVVAWRRGRRGLGIAVLTGLLLSLGIEVVQYFIPGRDSSVLDLVANVLGAALGAFLAMAGGPGTGLIDATPPSRGR